MTPFQRQVMEALADCRLTYHELLREMDRPYTCAMPGRPCSCDPQVREALEALDLGGYLLGKKGIGFVEWGIFERSGKPLPLRTLDDGWA